MATSFQLHASPSGSPAGRKAMVEATARALLARRLAAASRDTTYEAPARPAAADLIPRPAGTSAAPSGRVFGARMGGDR